MNKQMLKIISLALAIVLAVMGLYAKKDGGGVKNIINNNNEITVGDNILENRQVGAEKNNVLVSDVDPERLVEIIKEQQQLYVKKSYGEYQYQCFTDNDLSLFISKSVPSTIKESLIKSSEFIALIGVIKKMSPADRGELYDKALNTFKPTWAQLGRISEDGQTDAGQTAEKIIAKSVVDLVQDMVEK